MNKEEMDRTSVKLLLVSALPPPSGGIATWTETLVNRGLPSPFELELVDTRVSREHYLAPTRPDGAEIRRTARILLGIHRSLQSRRFSLMHLNCSLYYAGAIRNLAATLIARYTKVPYIAHLHGSFIVPCGNAPLEIMFRSAYRSILCNAAGILVTGRPSYESVMDFGDFGDKTVLMPNFVDTQAMPSPPEQRPTGEKLKVVYVGALAASKGIDTILKIANELAEARFRLIGEGPQSTKDVIANSIRRRGLNDRVEMTGPLSHEDVLAALVDSDVFLFPSKREGFPIAVAEAMASGLPVVASPVGAIPDMIDAPNGGYLVDQDNVSGFVSALSNLRGSPSVRHEMGAYNREKAIREYDFSTVVAQLCDIYSKIV